MIHICTVHWQDPRWIDIQLAYIERFVGEPYRLYSIFTGIPAHYREKFFYVREEDLRLHEAKLNVLADVAWFNRESDEDLLVFLDGDAFPIAELCSFARERLRDYPLIAVRRDENSGDFQPHPSFCMTTLKFWRSIGGDWNKGFHWRTRDGRWRTDVGARLYEQLYNGGHDWYALQRSNRVDLHPLYFGLYDDVIYHHGAGFRQLFSTIDADYLPWLLWLYDRKVFPRLSNRVRYRINHGRFIAAKNERVSRMVIERIRRDADFFALLQQAVTPDALAQELGIQAKDLLKHPRRSP
ncbi:MAG: hypothetical protein AAGI11_06965 [Pseudomonadota bacterium]